MKKIPVLIVGGDHYNMLGVIRSLKNKNYDIYSIITCDDKYTFCSKSKYLKDSIVIKNDKWCILDTLINWLNLKEKIYLIPTSDMASLVIDENLNKLKTKYIVGNINNKQNEIKKIMDKMNQYELFKKLKLNTPYSEIIDLKKYNKELIPFPCILKPLVSANGSKDDIVIINSQKELACNIKSLISKGYKEVLLQEFMKIDKEFDVGGCCCGDNIFIAGFMKKIHIYPPLRGSTCMGKIYPVDKGKEFTKIINKIFKEINYNGIFDIDFFEVNNKLYINEINFRNGAISYIYTYGNRNVVDNWIKLNEKQIIEDKVIENYYFVEEIGELKLFKEKHINCFSLLKSLITIKCKMYWNWKDPKPFMFKFINSFKRKLKKEK